MEVFKTLINLKISNQKEKVLFLKWVFMGYFSIFKIDNNKL